MEENMSKTYINDAIIGNSRMLGCLTGQGLLQRLYWPNIDHLQFIDRFESGIKLGGEEAVFLTAPGFEITQSYRRGTNIIDTTYLNKELGLKIIQSDFCLADKDVLIRQYEITNLSHKEQELKWLLYSSAVTATSHYTGTLFDFHHEALVHYQRDIYMSISADREAEGYQIGKEALRSLAAGMLHSGDDVLMVPDGALIWNLGTLGAKTGKKLTMQICFAAAYPELRKVLGEIRKLDGEALLQDTKHYWQSYLEGCRPASSKNEIYNELYERSLLVFRLMYDESSGGLMAAPEPDENMERCGRYAYCWGRDAAFIADALDQCGLHLVAEHFYEFAAAAQEEDGSWFQRYCMDGNLAPAWGLQIDETGALLYGIWKHYTRTKEEAFLQKHWEKVRRSMHFLTGFTDPETGLPKPSRDLWEERWGEHTYSAAAVHAGLAAGIRIARCLGAPEELVGTWETSAAKLKAAIEKELWDEEKQCFLRGVRTQLPEQKLKGLECITIQANAKGSMRKVACRDSVVDVSLIGLSVPFEVLEAKDPRMRATAARIQEVLDSEQAGGIKRYEDDEYIGGNPWILTTLWLALYYAENREYDKALKHFNWAVEGRTKLNLLPEQISGETGEPVWVIPLTWSHAMYVLAYHALSEAFVL